MPFYNNLSDQINHTTWALFTGPTTQARGLYYFSDVGINGSLWYNNGVTIDPVGPITLYRLSTPFQSTNGTAEETYAVTGVIPAGVLAVGRMLKISLLMSKSATSETTSNIIKIGTNADGKTSATSLSSGLSLSSTSRQLAFTQKSLIVGATSVQQESLSGGATPFGISTVAISAARTITDINNPLYISLTGTKTTGGIETVTCVSFNVELN